jgi:CRP-like cAMP-binding protein
LSEAETLASLRDAPLFKGLTDAILKELAPHCDIWKLEVGEQVRINPKNVPIFLITKGCIAATSTTGFGRFQKIVLALIMPSQLVCEFEYFGNTLPETAGLRAVDETEMIAIPALMLTNLISSYQEVMRNLATMLVTKINICNFHLEAVSQTQGDKKIATLLSGFVRLTEWVPSGYQDVRGLGCGTLSEVSIQRPKDGDTRSGRLGTERFDQDRMARQYVNSTTRRWAGRPGGVRKEEDKL